MVRGGRGRNSVVERLGDFGRSCSSSLPKGAHRRQAGVPAKAKASLTVMAFVWFALERPEDNVTGSLRSRSRLLKSDLRRGARFSFGSGGMLLLSSFPGGSSRPCHLTLQTLAVALLGFFFSSADAESLI